MPLFGIFERRIRELVYITIIKIFGVDWYDNSFSQSLQDSLKGKGNKTKMVESALNELTYEQLKEYDEIRKQYPETISKDQFYRIAHISKATALYLLQSGLVPCIDSGKKTRRYTIRTEDVITYLMEREIHPEDYRAPEMWYAKRSGRTKPRKKRCNRLKKLSETEKKHFRTYMEAKLEDYDDLLKVADVTEVIGYSSASVHLWCKNKKLQAFRVSGKFLVPKSCFLDFMVSESCFDIRCKTNEHISLVRSFLEQFADGM